MDDKSEERFRPILPKEETPTSSERKIILSEVEESADEKGKNSSEEARPELSE